jgi:hypothetical protein
MTTHIYGDAAAFENDPLYINIWYSLNVVRGAMFTNPDFGLKKRTVRTTDDDSMAELKQDYNNALQWIIDLGRAVAIDIVVQRNASLRTRADAVISITRPDKTIQTYNVWQDVL